MSLAAKIDNALLLNHEPEIEKFFQRIKIIFGKTDP